MKHLRILVLVLLSILLPVQGAMAAAMLCPSGTGTGPAAVVAAPDAHAHHMPDERPAAQFETPHHTGGEALDQPSATVDHPTTCPFCASGCCMAAMIGTVPSVGQPVPAAPADFPALAPRVPAFQSDGQERPPRTC